MTDHDDTPSTEARKQAERELEGMRIPNGVTSPESMDVRHEMLIHERMARNRLAARVAELETALEEAWSHDEMVTEERNEAVCELAKLRAAAAPVEPARDESALRKACEVISRECEEACSRGLNAARDEYIREPEWVTIEDVRDIARDALKTLALPPQEDVRGAIATVLRTALVESANDMLSTREAKLTIAIREAIALLGAAPRTEGGGDHGE